MIVYMAPNRTAYFNVVATSGLVGVLGVKVTDAAGASTVTARTTDGITEPDGDGNYVVAVTAPGTTGTYRVVTDDGAGNVTVDDLVVTFTPPTSPAPAASHDYITADDVKATLTLDGTTYADPDVDRAVQAANAAIDQLFGRAFAPDTDPTDRYYNIRRRSRDVVEIHDLTRTTTIAVAYDTSGGGTFSQTLVENTDYQLEPLNAELDGVPYEQIRSRRGQFGSGSRVLKVTGTFGWPGAPPPQIITFAEVLAVKFLARIREAPFGVVTAGADMGVAMRLAKTDPDFPTLSAGLCRGAQIA